MKVYEFWCIGCPTRLHIEHDTGAVEFWQGCAYTSCPVCGGSLIDPNVLMTRGIDRYSGKNYRINGLPTNASASATAGSERVRRRGFDEPASPE